MPVIFNTDCTEALVVECAADIEMTVRACSAAFESEGANIIADIKCAKDLMADKKHCWPCICAEAKKRGWHVIGCWSWSNIHLTSNKHPIIISFKKTQFCIIYNH